MENENEKPYAPFHEPIEVYLENHMEDLRNFAKNLNGDDDDNREIAEECLQNYGLSVEYKGSYILWLIGCGGPNVGFKIFYNEDFEVTEVIFYRSWSIYEEKVLDFKDLDTFKDTFLHMLDLESYIKDKVTNDHSRY